MRMGSLAIELTRIVSTAAWRPLYPRRLELVGAEAAPALPGASGVHEAWERPLRRCNMSQLATPASASASSSSGTTPT
jgi:hypothetical protein